MSKIVSFNLSDIDSALLADLQQRYGAVQVDVHLPLIESDDAPFSRDDFWEVIGKLDWEVAPDGEEVMEPAVHYLSEQPVMNIYLFEAHLRDLLFALDTYRHARYAGFNAYTGKEGDFSVDSFLYQRCFVVSLGQDKYREILNNPRNFPAEGEFSDLLDLAALAYERKTGKEFEYSTETSYETFSNKLGWETAA